MNARNQYTQRTVAGAVDVFGIANPTAAATVNAVAADRHGEYFHRVVSVNNSSAAQYPTLTVVSEYGATQSSTGQVFVARSPEAYTHDADGNLTQDGRCVPIWGNDLSGTLQGASRIYLVAGRLPAGPDNGQRTHDN